MATDATAPDRGPLGYLGLALSIILVAAGLVLGVEHWLPGGRSAAPATAIHAAGRPPELIRSGTVDEVQPVRLQIPSLGLDKPLLRLGLDRDGELQVPTMAQAGEPGWYRYSPAPGDVGPAVIAGHVDSTTGPAVFYRLRHLDAGDIVRVRRNDGKVAVFTVKRVQLVTKKHFPTKEVYGPIRYAGLRLITCGGGYDKAKGGYQSNLVVFARLDHLQKGA